MKIIVLGGSPKGEKSVTMQYVEYLKRRYSNVDFDVRQPAIRIRRLEQDSERFDEIIDAVKHADAVLWAFPLYIHTVCSQYHRFIELISEHDAGAAFAGKPTATLSTSIHFFDNTAHDFIRAVCDDLEMAFVDSHSAGMNDLTKPEGRVTLEGFFETFIDAVENGTPVVRQFSAIVDGSVDESSDIVISPNPQPVLTGKRITIVTDTNDGTLGTMIERFRSSFKDEVEVVDLRNIRIAGGCMGCLQCGPKNICRYGDSDDVMKTYIEKIHPADIYVMAATIKGRWYSSLMKSFVDRGFFHTHQPFLSGKQTAVLLEGDITSNPVIREGLTGYFEWQGASLSGIVASGISNPEQIGSALDALARRIVVAQKTGYRRQATFLGVGGIKVFRDDIYTHLRMVFHADHKYYRKNGIYATLPHMRPLKMWGYRLVGLVTSIPLINRKMMANMRDFMLMPYRRVVREAGGWQHGAPKGTLKT